MANENMSANSGAGKAAPVPFSFNRQLVRVVSRSDGDWFVATDAARILGYRDAATAIRMLDQDEKGTHLMRTPGGPQELLICSEPGLYKLIASTTASQIQKPSNGAVFEGLEDRLFLPENAACAGSPFGL